MRKEELPPFLSLTVVASATAVVLTATAAAAVVTCVTAAAFTAAEAH